MTRLLLISGSLRRDSFNSRLLHRIGDMLATRCELDYLIPIEVGLPLFDQDYEGDTTLQQKVMQIHTRFSAADGVIVACPEYNGQPTAYLKNLIDWLTRMAYVRANVGNPLIDVPVLLCSASTGSSGGSLAIPSLRALFGYVGAVVIGDSFTLPFAQRLWSEDSGYKLAKFQEQHLAEAVQRVLKLATARLKSQ